MASIVCLANSYKHQGRCIAGIDIDIGKWVRPVPKSRDAIYSERFVDSEESNEPKLLDLLEIPIGDCAPDKGCQPENRYLAQGVWRRIRRLSISEVEQYIENTPRLLHNRQSKVDPEIFEKMPRSQWKSLQLICVTNPDFGLNPWRKKRCIFTYSGTPYELKVTDPIIIAKMENGDNISNECLLTISMATPYKPPSYEKPYCWKMVAAVIEL
jgi:hypothetical protein